MLGDDETRHHIGLGRSSGTARKGKNEQADDSHGRGLDAAMSPEEAMISRLAKHIMEKSGRMAVPYDLEHAKISKIFPIVSRRRAGVMTDRQAETYIVHHSVADAIEKSAWSLPRQVPGPIKKVITIGYQLISRQRT